MDDDNTATNVLFAPPLFPSRSLFSFVSKSFTRTPLRHCKKVDRTTRLIGGCGDARLRQTVLRCSRSTTKLTYLCLALPFFVVVSVEVRVRDTGCQ